MSAAATLDVPEFVQTDERGLVRETRSHALLNTDKAALARNRQARQRAQEQIRTNQEVRELRFVVSTLESRILELTSLVDVAVASLKR